jgi:predicted O-methyltransferase YrrM
MIDFIEEEATALKGAFSQYDMMALYPALIKIPKDGLYVEIGVRNGRSLMFARKHSKGTVVGIDIGHEIFLDKFKDEKNWEFIHKESNEAVKTWNRPIDVLFIDADHTYEGVKDDWDNFSPFVKPGGIVYFHDCDETSPGVVQLFEEIGEGWTDKTRWTDTLELAGRKTSVASVVKL